MRLPTRCIFAFAVFLFSGLTSLAGDRSFTIESASSQTARRVRVAQGIHWLSGSPTHIPIIFDSLGDEHEIRFSLNWNPMLMRFVRVDPVTSAPADMSVEVNSSQMMSGRIGIILRSSSGFQQGSRGLLNIIGYHNNSTSPVRIDMVDVPISRSVSALDGNPLESDFVGNSYNIGFAHQNAIVSVENYSVVRGRLATAWIRLDRSFGGYQGASNISFSVRWDPSVFDYADASLGPQVPAGAAMTLDESMIREGFLGVSIMGNSPFLDSTDYRLLMLSLVAREGVPPALYAISFDDKPTLYRSSTPSGVPTSTYWLPGFMNVGNFSYAYVSGFVTSPDIVGLRNLPVVLTDSAGFSRTNVTTGPFGQYIFEGLVPGSDYLLTVKSKRYRFAPVRVNITQNTNNLNLRALE